MPLFLAKPKKHAEPVKTSVKLPTFVAKVENKRVVELDLPKEKIRSEKKIESELNTIDEELKTNTEMLTREL